VKQTGPDSELKTVWDECKEQVQYEEYDSFSLYQDMIVAMVRDMIDLEDNYDIELLHYFFRFIIKPGQICSGFILLNILQYRPSPKLPF
jgi:hypothetical protein